MFQKKEDAIKSDVRRLFQISISDNLIHHLQNFQESKRQTSVETAWNRWSSDQGWWTTGKILSCESATKKCEEKKLKKTDPSESKGILEENTLQQSDWIRIHFF